MASSATRGTSALEVAPLSANHRTNVAIIGAGVSGALLADRLSSDGVEVAVIDRRPPASGSTAASTAMLMYELDATLLELQDRLGTRDAARAYRASLEALRSLAILVPGLDDRCDFAARKSLYFASRRRHARTFAAECDARRALEIEVVLLSRDEIERQLPFSAPAALLSHEAAQIDPVRLTRSLLRRAVSRGVPIFSPVAVQHIETDHSSARLHTESGFTIDARCVVVAAGYEVDAFLPKPFGSLTSSYAVCSRPIVVERRWREDWLIWESARPYSYVRTTGDGRAIIGGKDLPFKNEKVRDSLLARRTRALVRRFHDLFPNTTFEPEFAWTGTFGETDDGLPYIGAVPERPRHLFAMGYGGNGITFSVLAAQILADAVQGRRHPDADLFGFERGGRSS